MAIGKFLECKRFGNIFFQQKKILFAEMKGLFAHILFIECFKNLCNFGNKKCQPKNYRLQIFRHFFWLDCTGDTETMQYKGRQKQDELNKLSQDKGRDDDEEKERL